MLFKNPRKMNPTKELKAAPTLTKLPFVRTAPTVPDMKHMRIKNEDLIGSEGASYSVVHPRSPRRAK